MIPNFVKPSCPACGEDIDRWHSMPKNSLDDVLTLYPCKHVFEGEEARNVHEYMSLNWIGNAKHYLGDSPND